MLTQLDGPYELSVDCIDRSVPPRTPGVFLLGYVDVAGTFRVQYVGRNDEDLRTRLRELIGSSSGFKFAGAMTTQEAFARECELFHRFKPRSNFMHPQRPTGTDWRCPQCIQLHFA